MQIDLDDPPYIDYTRCTACGLCVQACPSVAITMQNTKIPNLHRAIR
jgi:formate hydrogenlyase subunit 6/NADH:ubiquinone oxidoreductase subunit I